MEYNNYSPPSILEKVLTTLLEGAISLLASGIDKIEYASGIGHAIEWLPEGIIDVGWYFLIQEPWTNTYSLQISKKFLLNGNDGNGDQGLNVKYSSPSDKKLIVNKIVRIQQIYNLLYKYRGNIGFSKILTKNYKLLNHIPEAPAWEQASPYCPDYQIFMKDLLNIIHKLYKGDLEELKNDMAIIRKYIMHQIETNILLSDQYLHAKLSLNSDLGATNMHSESEQTLRKQELLDFIEEVEQQIKCQSFKMLFKKNAKY